MSDPVIICERMSFGYDSFPILDNLDFAVEKSDFLVIIGPNGCGKTTLLKIFLGLLRPTGGRVRVLGQHPECSRTRIGYVPQYIDFDRSFPVTAAEVVLSGTIGAGSLFPWHGRAARQKSAEIMDMLGIGSLAERVFGTLSGGEKQRTLLGRALVSSPEILVLDEPTASIDHHAEKDIYDFLKELNATMPIILVSHDIGFICSYVNKVACLNRRISIQNLSEISRDRLSDLYDYPARMIEHQCGL